MARILSGKEVASDIRQRLQVEVASYGKSFQPGLTIVQVRNHTPMSTKFDSQTF